MCVVMAMLFGLVAMVNDAAHHSRYLPSFPEMSSLQGITFRGGVGIPSK